VASIEAPSGWHLLGRTPVRAFMPDRDPVFLFAAGDRVRFEPVDASRWDALDAAAAAGETVAEAVG
jgi:5-oxoprolinase (ATP-hydrolysing) subunit B